MRVKNNQFIPRKYFRMKKILRRDVENLPFDRLKIYGIKNCVKNVKNLNFFEKLRNVQKLFT